MNASDILRLIDDGKWHSLPDLAEELGAPPDQLAETVKSLSEYNLVEFEEEAERVRLSSWVRKFPAAVEVEEGKPAVGTIIIPPGGSITIQETLISNLTDTDIELSVRIDRKIRELAISRVK